MRHAVGERHGPEDRTLPACRVAVWSHYAGAGAAVAFVRVGTLDEPDHLPPDIHIFTASKQPWVVRSPRKAGQVKTRVTVASESPERGQEKR